MSFGHLAINRASAFVCDIFVGLNERVKVKHGFLVFE